MTFQKLFALTSFLSASVAARQNAGLQWGPCDAKLEPRAAESSVADCAVLEVPLDYTNKDSSETLKLDLLRVNGTKGGSGGSILYNPGGPGASPLGAMMATREIYEPALDGAFSLIGFAPRGTEKGAMFTCPSYMGPSNSSSSSNTRRDELPSLDMQTELVNGGWASANELAEACRESGPELARFMSTAFVARDMLEIVEALDEDGMLRYLGTSYGTFLGQTFASMFPDRVDRMYLDAVVDTDDYISGYWPNALTDADAAFENFLTECLATSPEFCALANLTTGTEREPTVETLTDIFADFLSELKSAGTTIPDALGPLPWETGHVSAPAASVIKRHLFSTLYHGSRFPLLAELLATVITTGNLSLYSVPDLTEMDEIYPFYGIACSDSLANATSPEDMLDTVAEQQNASIFADAYLPQFWLCSVWPFEPAERFTGPFGANKTANPILFAGGRFDPVTPLSAAQAAADKFEGAGLLVHPGVGHSVTGQPNNCSWGVIRNYFADGTLPEEGMECETDEDAFEFAIRRALERNATEETAANETAGADGQAETGAAPGNVMTVKWWVIAVGCLVVAAWSM